MKDVKNIQELIDRIGISYKRNFDLSKRSPMKAGGTCDYFFEPNSKEQLVELIKGLRQIHKEFIVVGFLSNVIFRDGRIRTPIIFTGKLKTFRLDVDDRLHVDAGCSLSFVANELTQKGFKGFSGLSGFPATIGGAIFMNASCYGNSISDYLDYVECIDKAGQLIRFEKDELQLSWRYSIFHQLPNSYVIVSSSFRLIRGEVIDLKKIMELTKKHRQQYQEHRLPNLGSTFATENIYRDICDVNIKYRIFYTFLRVLILWIGRILSADVRYKLWALAINKFTQKYFNLESDVGVGFSNKTFNCIVNIKDSRADDIIKFIKKIDNTLRINVPIENIIIENID